MSRWIPGYEYLDENRPAPAKRRFTTAKAIYDVYDEFRRLDVKDAERRSRIKRIYNAFLPYDPEELRAAGQAWRTNVNFRAVASAVDARADSVESLGVDPCPLVTLMSGTPESAGPDDTRVSTVLSEEFSRALRSDRRVISALAMMNKEADLYGLGPLTWRDPDDYVPVALERAQIVFDPDGPSVSSDHEIVFVDTALPATTVFRVIEEPKLAEGLGWNIAAMKRYAERVFRDQVETTTGYSTESGVPPEERLLDLLRNNNFLEANQFRKFHVLFVYVREMASPRKVTHIIVPADRQDEAIASDNGILYEKENAYDTLDQVFVWHAASSTQRYAKAVRGIASALAPIAATQDRVLCSIIDGTIRAMSLVVKQKNPGTTPTLSLQELGPYTVVGSDLEPMPNANQMSNFQGAMQVNEMLTRIGAGSVAGTTLSPTFPRVFEGGQQPSKAEAEMRERIRTRRDENHAASRMWAWDAVFAETWRRFLSIATGPKPMLDEYPHVAEFVKRCEMRGVSKDMLREAKDAFVVMTNRDLVIGGEGIVQFLTALESQSMGNADEAGRRAISHDKVRYRLGQEAANRYFPIQSRDATPTNDASIATGENNDIRRQEQVLVGDDQRHFTHIRVHMEILQEVRRAVEQGLEESRRISAEQGGVTQDTEGRLAPRIEDPERLAAVLQAASQHIQAHLERGRTQLGVGPEVRNIERTLAGLADTIHALNLAIAEQRRVREAEQEKQQREMEELQRRADQNDLEKARYEIDKQAENKRYEIDKMHEVEMAKLQMLGQEGQQRLALEGQEKSARGRLEFEQARNRAMIESEQARHQMGLKSAESEQTRRLAADEAQRKAADAAANKIESAGRVAAVTGRENPQPSDIIEGAAGGLIPL